MPTTNQVLQELLDRFDAHEKKSNTAMIQMKARLTRQEGHIQQLLQMVPSLPLWSRGSKLRIPPAPPMVATMFDTRGHFIGRSPKPI